MEKSLIFIGRHSELGQFQGNGNHMFVECIVTCQTWTASIGVSGGQDTHIGKKGERVRQEEEEA
jgi:hypothetical protein